jgi:hypothetical protein
MGGGTASRQAPPPWRYGRWMPASTQGHPFGSWTGRAVSARCAPAAAGSRPGPTIMIVGPGSRPSASRLIGAAARGFKVVISGEPADSGGHNLIKSGILPVCMPLQTVAELQAMVDSDPGVLVTVDIFRCDVRARGEFVARFGLPPFWPGRPAEGMAASLLMAQRLLGSAGLTSGDRIRLQRRFAAICDAMKAQGADAARTAWRLDRLIADIATKCQPGRAGPAQGQRDASR